MFTSRIFCSRHNLSCIAKQSKTLVQSETFSDRPTVLRNSKTPKTKLKTDPKLAAERGAAERGERQKKIFPVQGATAPQQLWLAFLRPVFLLKLLKIT
jgi:hypothetical protein